LTALEYGTCALAFSSGCGATATLLHTLKMGDHVVVCDDVYGGTNRYMRRFSTEKHGIQCEFVDMTDIKNVTSAIKKETKMIWIETPTNPTLKIVDINAIVKEVRAID
jgi:cystathionine gamma-lyase